MARQSDPSRRGGDAWAFAGADGTTPLTPYLGWLWEETRQLRRWSRENWDDYNRVRQRRRRESASEAFESSSFSDETNSVDSVRYACRR
jgi:hypothetical protein